MDVAHSAVPVFDWGTISGWALGWLATVAASAWLTARLIPWLRSHGAVVPATAESPDRGMPRGGGLAMVTVVVAVAVAAAVQAQDAAWLLAGGLLPAVAVAVVSLRDDFHPLPALGRLAVHVAAATAVTAILGPVREISVPMLGTVQLGVGAWPATVLWIVALTNAFNFMDGIDGIAGLSTVAAAAAIAVAAAAQAAPAATIVAAALAAAALGFLSCNWHPARVFMGDVGSTWCGFLVAVLPLLLPAAEQRAALLAVAACATWPFLFDTGWTLLKRVWHGENVLLAHRGHIYQRLVAGGWSHRGVATLYAALASIAVGLALPPLFVPALRSLSDSFVVAAIGLGCGLLLVLAAAACPRAHGDRSLPNEPRGWYPRIGKRCADVLAALLLVLLLAPVMMAVWVMVRLVLGPPVLFEEERAGRDGRPIRILKFRSMSQATDPAGRLLPDAERLGAFGSFLRRTSLDELPQLFSVLRGDMSMVGPRPLPLRYLTRYDQRQAVRLLVRPGLTGWAQIHGRNAVDWPRRLEYDVEYVGLLGGSQGFRTDLWIVCVTVFQIIWQGLTGRGIVAPGSATMQEFQP